jgi:hypothetical protein
MKRPPPSEPETLVGNCSGCNVFPRPLFKIPGLFRYRCDECFERELGYRHHLAPPREPARIITP